MTYKGYEGVGALDEEAGLFTVEVINTRDVITFQGSSVEELKRAFEDSVDDYLEYCATRGKDPEKPFSGTLSLRLPSDLHRRIALEARRAGQSLNSYTVGCLDPKDMRAR